MNNDPLLSCRIKIDRATKHLNELVREIEAYQGRDPNRISVDTDSEPAIKIYRFHIIEPMPEQWSAIIGDAIHNLRGALDCLATALVLRAGHTDLGILQDTYFPISWDEPSLSTGKRAAFFERIGPAPEKLIRRLQPYRRGKGDTLWRLNQLDIIDKHRRIIPAGAGLRQIDFLTPGTAPSGNPTKPVYDKEPPFPLKEGDEIFRSVFFEEHFDANTNFSLEVAFNEPGIAAAEPVLPTLMQFIDFVQRIVDIFEKSFF